jgi:hypothetical protein
VEDLTGNRLHPHISHSSLRTNLFLTGRKQTRQYLAPSRAHQSSLLFAFTSLRDSAIHLAFFIILWAVQATRGIPIATH